MGFHTTTCVWWVKITSSTRTCPCHTHQRHTIQTRNRRFRLRPQCGSITEAKGQMAPSSLPIKISKPSRTKLQFIWQGNACNNGSPRQVASSLLGAKLQFEIWTDHHNLTYFKKPQKMNRRQARWITELQEYNFTLHHKPGKTNIKADLLSRWLDHKRGRMTMKTSQCSNHNGLEA